MANNKNITFDQLQTSLKKIKSVIDGKANTSHGNHVPTTGTADNATYLRNDNSWHKIVPSDIGAAPSVHGTHVTYSTTAPSAPGTASAGTAGNVSRGDHVHPLQTTISGNAGSATKLANARNLTVGNTKKSFNGSADVSWSLNEIGAAASSHTHNYLVVKGENTISNTTNDTTANWKDQGNSVHWYTKPNQITGQPSPYGFLTNWASGGDVHQLWMTQSSGNMFHRGGNSAGWYGTWRTIIDECNFTSYSPTLSGGGAMGTWGISVTGNAGTATKLAASKTINGTSFDGSSNIITANWGTARTITIGNKGKSVNGSADVSWTLDEIGAFPSTGGILSSGVGIVNTYGEAWFDIGANDTYVYNKKSNKSLQLKHTGELVYDETFILANEDEGGKITIKSTANDNTTNYGVGGSDVYIDNVKSGKALQLKNDGTLRYDNNVILDSSNYSSYISGDNLHGLINSDFTVELANTAKTLATARTIALDGDVTGSVSFNGGSNVTINTNRRRCVVGQTKDTASKPYYRFAYITANGSNMDREIAFKVSTGFSNTEASGILRAHLRTNASNYIDNAQLYWEYANTGIDESNFILAYGTGANPTVELWVKCDWAWMMYHFEVIQEIAREESYTAPKWTLQSCCQAGYADSPTSGYTQVPSTLLQLKNNEFDNLTVSGELSADVITVNEINNAQYPSTLDDDIQIEIDPSNGSDDVELADGAVYKTIAGAIDALPKFLNGKRVNIWMRANITENADFKNYTSGQIRFYLDGHTLYGYIRNYMSSAKLWVYGGWPGTEQGHVGIVHPNVGCAVADRTGSFITQENAAINGYSLKIYGSDNLNSSGTSGTVGIIGDSFATAYIKDVEFVNCNVGFRGSAGARIHDTASSGVCSQYGYQVTSGAFITIANAAHCGGKTANTAQTLPGQIIAHSSATYAGGNQTTDSTPAPTPVTTKVTTIKSSSGDSYRRTVYNNWKKDNTVRQGDYGFGDCDGCWFFGTQFNQFKGKNISKIELTISRISGGQYAAVPIVVKTHSYTSRPGGAPSFITNCGSVSIATGNKGKLTITNSTVLNALKNGTIKGFGIQSSYNAANYAVCSGSLTMKVTYTE